MFMVVSFPWPVPSANVELTELQSPRQMPARPGAPRDGSLQPELAAAGLAR
jgi:hypothetical protein